MIELSDAHAMAIERSCAVTAVALSGQRREGVRLVTGEHRKFSLSSTLGFVHVPYPSIGRDWTRRTLTCGVALQCSPSKERITEFRLHELTARELRALTIVEAGVALGWVASRWPGLLPEIRRLLPQVHYEADDMDAVLKLLEKYSQVPISFADACLVRMTEVVNDPTLLTTDADFRIYRRHGRQTIPCVLPG